MLRIYPVVLEVLKQLQPALQRIEGKDRDLARQLRRASSSVALNLGEGMYSRGQNRNARYHTALGSARETLSCLEVAAVFGYVREDEQLNDQLNRIVGTLVRLVRA
jgi:four helix bundle protein